jgi:ketosteroid isomerase-like protein
MEREPCILLAAAMMAMALLAGCKGGHSSRQALLDADLRFARETSAKGLEGWLNFFDEEATIFPESGPMITGLPAIRAYYARTGFDPGGLSWKPDHADVAASGDLGYTYGTWTFYGPREKGAPVLGRGKYVTIWHKRPDGSWKVIADIGNSEPPSTPSADRPH